MTVKAAVFDLGNVLLQWDPEGYYDSKFGEARRKAFFDAVPIEEVNHRSDQGESLSQMVAELAEEFPDWATEIRVWSDEWIKICAPAIKGSVILLEQLKQANVPVFSLTNFGDETFEIARQTYSFLDLFDQQFVSARLKVVKPDPGIYEALEQATGFSGGELIFTDDKLENIQAAAARGWKTHHFTSSDGWARALVSAGLLERSI